VPQFWLGVPHPEMAREARPERIRAQGQGFRMREFYALHWMIGRLLIVHVGEGEGVEGGVAGGCVVEDDPGLGGDLGAEFGGEIG